MRAASLSKPWQSAVLLIGLLWLTVALAEVAVPRLDRRVTDLTSTLSDQQQTALENKLAEFERQKGSQIALLMVASTKPEDIAQYAIRVVEQWKLGRKRVDDGVLVLLAKDDRTTRIEVGYGLEGVIPDAIAKRIIEEIMIPKFRQGDFAGGIDAGVDRIIGLIQGEPLAEPEPQASDIDSVLGQLPLLFILAIAGGWILRAMFGRFLGGLLNGGLLATVIWLLGAGLFLAVIVGFFAFLFTISDGRGGYGDGGGFSGGGGGGFSGGGGGFGGGGASGSW
jgi:uncharacterized protein